MSNIPKQRILAQYESENKQLKFLILNKSVKENKKFKRIEKKTSFIIEHNFGDYIDLSFIRQEIEKNFDKLIKNMLESSDPNDYCAIEIHHDSLENPIYIAPQKIKKLKTSVILDRIEKFAQSNKKLLSEGTIDLRVTIIKNIRGGGRKRKLVAPETKDVISKKKYSIITVNNKDYSCAYRALFISKYHYDNRENLIKKDWLAVRNDYRKMQTIGARKIAHDCGLDFEKAVGFEEWSIIQDKFKDYQIHVIDAAYKSNFIFKGPSSAKKIYIEYIEDHYNAITNIRGYMACGRFYCQECHKVFSQLFDHRCPSMCIQCYSNCGEEICKIKCDDCKRDFKSETCYTNHLNSKICKYIKFCENCEMTCKAKVHTCGTTFCKRCKASYEEQPHFCNIKPADKEKLIEEDNINKIIVSYDIESTQENGEHVPNLLINKTKCDKCSENVNNEGCDICYIEKPRYYFGRDCVKRFVDYLFGDLAKRAEKTKSLIYGFAHNARGYDGQFVLRQVWNKFYNKVDVVMRGRKILVLKCGNVKLLDSLNFFLQPLEKLPQALGLDVSVKKGDFPHLFNCYENYNYTGQIPDLKYFNLEYVSPNKRAKVEKWHEEYRLSGKVWNFHNELIDYCENDVNILMECVMKFRKIFKEITDLDPMTRSFTLASIGLEIFKAKFLNPETLAITPVEGYSAVKNHSKVADIWLDWVEKCEKFKLKREFRIGKYWVDGYDTKNNTVYEFNGCRWHGHECQTQPYTDKYLEYKEKLAYLLSKGYIVKELWECKYKEMRKLDLEMKNYYNERYNYYTKIEKYGNADIRETFFGGRTNNLKFYQEIDKQTEEIKYLDFCSLYPYVLKNRKYPIGHPNVVRENFDYSLKSYFGFVKCCVVPPRGLYLPVLPVVINDKLMFPLCPNCALINNSNCECLNREMIGTWTTEELKKSLEKGYIIKEIFEVLNYSGSAVDEQLFKRYVDMWLKIKQQASGWPSWIDSEDKKLKYIENYKDKEGIELEYDKIERNEALRFIAKIMLNSFWGKLAQRPNQPRTAIINSYDQYFEIMIDTDREIKGESMVNEDTLIVTWEYVNDSKDQVKNYNIAVASYVTAWARLKLYELMDEIERLRPYSLLYHDTDSVLFVRNLNDPEIATGDYLGELTDEIGTKGKCTKFVSLGPKNYAYVIEKENGSVETEIKCKGISLICKAKEIVNFENMINLAELYSKDNTCKELSVPQSQFVINNHCQIFTRYFEKIYKAVSEKRTIHNENNDIITLPFGY